MILYSLLIISPWAVLVFDFSLETISETWDLGLSDFFSYCKKAGVEVVKSYIAAMVKILTTTNYFRTYIWDF